MVLNEGKEEVSNFINGCAVNKIKKLNPRSMTLPNQNALSKHN